jgi:hypothetical protein
MQLAGVLFASSDIKTVEVTTSEASIIGRGVGSTILPPNFFSAGKSIRITLRALLQCSGTQPIVTIRLKLGATLALTGGKTVTVGGEWASFPVDGIITCLSNGVDGIVIGQWAGLVNSLVTSAIGVDTTRELPIDVTVQFKQTRGILKVTNFLIESLSTD